MEKPPISRSPSRTRAPSALSWEGHGRPAGCIWGSRSGPEGMRSAETHDPTSTWRSAAISYGVTTVPRFALIDKLGQVRWTFTGIGAETGFLVREEVDRLVLQFPRTPRAIQPLHPDRSGSLSCRPPDCEWTGRESRIHTGSLSEPVTGCDEPMTDYEIQGPTRVCAATGRLLKPGDPFHALLTQREGNSSVPISRPRPGPALRRRRWHTGAAMCRPTTSLASRSSTTTPCSLASSG